MRVLVIVKATTDSESGRMPDPEMIAAMGRFNEELAQAGILLAADGLHPSMRGKRVHFAGKSRTVVDGPFAETKELIAGYTLIQVRSRDEALEWTRRFPAPFGAEMDCEIEVRPLFELDDLTPSDAVERFRELHVGRTGA